MHAFNSPPDDTSSFRPASYAIPGAAFALAVLFGMNLLNYVDRSVFYAVGPSISDELHLNDRQYGLLASAFMVVYTLISPLMGWMGDRYSRRLLLACGVGLWSVATVGTAFALGYGQMFIWRALLGVGEASYGVVAPTLLADFFPTRLRGRIMGLFYLALPLGSALGYWLGGFIGHHYGWRTAFWVVGVPGLAVAFASLAIREPGRGSLDGEALGRPRGRDYLDMIRVPSFLLNMIGLAAVTFTTGAYYVWGPTFYHRVRHIPLHVANRRIAVLVGVASLIGITLGTWASERLARRTQRAYLLWAAFAVLLSMPFGFMGIIERNVTQSLSLLFISMVLMSSILGPCNTVPANVIRPNLRAAAYALNIFIIHLLGDISSPSLIGFVSDYLGQWRVVHSPLGVMLEDFGVNAVGNKNLTAAMLLVVPVLGLGVIAFVIGSRFLPADQDRARFRSMKAIGTTKAAQPSDDWQPEALV